MTLNLKTLLAIPYVDPDLGFDVSPDGQQVAFAWNRTGRWQIYVAPLDGSGPPQKLTSGPGAKFAPDWSPDGRSLAYVMDLDGSERYDIYLRNLATGDRTNLTADTPDAIQSSLAWSPDSQQLAFISDRSSRFDTYVMPLAGGKPRQVLSLPHPDWEVDWSPDGRWLAVVSEGPMQDYWTTVVPAAGGEPLTIGIDGEAICAKDACWSPDSARLAFASNVGGRYQVGLYALETDQITWLTSGMGECEMPCWSPGGQRLAFVVSHGPETEVALLDLASGETVTFQIAPGVHYHPEFTPDGEGLLVVFDNPRRPCALWRIDLEDSACQQLTFSLPSDVERSDLVLPAQVRYPGLDDVDVPALLYRPKATGALPPAVLYIHGGPNWLTQVTWDPLVQHMVSRGWVVLAPNYRGSTGYGRQWQLASRFDLGGVDTQDVVAGAKYLAAEAIADPERIAVTGRSWGGYLTMTCLTQYPDLWAAGSAVVPFLNWFTGHANSRGDLQHWDIENMGHPEENHDLWYERSPFFFLDRVRAPVQMIGGAHDIRCPASESVQARDRLQELGIACDLVLYEDEGHSFLKIENKIDAEKRRVTFLAQHLTKGE